VQRCRTLKRVLLSRSGSSNFERAGPAIDMTRRQVGVILTGGNIERARLLRILSGSIPAAA